MSLLSKVCSVLSALGRLFARPMKASAGTNIAKVVPAAVAVAAAPATAVAGFVHRVHVDRFFLAARTKSVAKLNTPVGRKPRTSSIPSPYSPAVPADRVGAKKIRSSSGRDLRVLGQIQARNARSAEIIPFPVARRGGVDEMTTVAEAA